MIVAICGGDAAGKQTQSKLLAEKIGATRFAFPNYESPTGAAILAHLRKEWTAHTFTGSLYGPSKITWETLGKGLLDPMVFQSLQTVNRLESLPAINYALTRGPVVFDRYWQSAVVYGTLDGLDPEWLRLVQERPMPSADVNILIDVPVDVGFERRPERRDRYESNREFMEKVRVEYLRLWGVSDLDWARTTHGALGDSCHKAAVVPRPGWWVVDGRGSVEETHRLIMQVLECDKAWYGERK